MTAVAVQSVQAQDHDMDLITPAQYKEGMKKFYVWANQYLSAKDSLQQCSVCTVRISAAVDSTGHMDSAWVSQSVNPTLDNNALRVVRAYSGEWKAGNRNGVPYATIAEIPIDFKVLHRYDPTIRDTGVHVLNGVIYRDAGFRGGKDAQFKQIAYMIKYPLDCREMQIQGEVIVAFTIDKEGKIQNARVKKSVHPSLDAEAMRVVKKTSGQYNPRTVNGVPYESQYEIPIEFKLNLKKRQ